MVLFYRSRHVTEACRILDPEPGLVGRCPQPLLGLAVAFAIGAVSTVAAPSYNFIFPIFGWLLTGAAGAVCWTLTAVVCLLLAWGSCRRRPWAWWIAFIGCVVAAASTVMTLAGNTPERIIGAMALPADQRAIIELLWPDRAWLHVAFWLAAWGSLAAYLIAIRPLFRPAAESPH
jgi:hypothetical protein